MIVVPNTLIREKTNLEADLKQNNDYVIEPLHINHSTIQMPQGIIGFEHVVEYTIELMEGGIIYKFAGIQDQTPLFYLINPYLIKRDYTISFRDEDFEILGRPKNDEIIVLSILTLKDDYEKVTCNLLGPLVINNSNGIAVQVINDSEDWSTKHLLSSGEKVSDGNLRTEV